ncbi:TPA: SMP-30/gluconolactonase/LRE family protein [Pseudomonas aeruginosa]|uniref:SMP-30/gluconolactonase/LRE family protein n=1 Tax=Pseudomonas aeruginosa TaxID=287 RepID=UPI0005B863C5|nr:SMP-30/gluconolactonase/LRE family protein [Pseudomonas aeruginosa]MCO3323393.1 SMP-30/gluconolactonase/LRE family protein [Pseudomonas aeruginosa]HBO5845100.1 SMP-30/gluconolactonase/LRE family protein [Pseudomonas aeruginosa]HBO5909668.1 SMP-30/gluconolactonase/LRE family protein [Pseudomonas aeruginosa]
MSRSRNPLHGWRLVPSDIHHVGHDLRRPECILAEPDGTLWSADARGGVMRIAADGSQKLLIQQPSENFDLDGNARASLLEGTLPNGLAFDRNGDFLIANFGTDALEIMTRDGRSRVLHDSIDGKPIGKVNFVLRDSRDRVWLTVSTRKNPWIDAIRNDLADGYIALLDDKGLRVVADGFAFTNEIRFDANEDYLYVAQTTGNCINRLKVAADGSLSGREIYGPRDLGHGLIDGIAFDAFGNLWGAMVFADRLIAITPEGDLLTLFDDGAGPALEKFQQEFQSGGPVSFETLSACGGTVAPWIASITFGGADLRTVYVGSLKGTTLPSFRSPVAGLPMVHWR